MKNHKMKYIYSLILVFSFAFHSHAQMFEHELIQTFTISDIEQVMEDLGLPQGLIPVNYEVDVYKVLYNTPYRHPDSLVQASGAIFIPKNVDCPLPIANYAHGTQSQRSAASSNLSGGQWDVSLLFAGGFGYMITSPDYIGLGDADPSVKVHPYTHAFSQSHTAINMIRSGRQLADILDVTLNDQIFLYGYSHGGFATVATHRLIEEEYPEEFHIAASAPMSGPYDLIGAQVDLIISTEEYATPGYLPYIVLAYKELFPDLLVDFEIEDVFVPPYDTLLPNLFYSGDYGIGYINNQCEPVPRDMINPTIMTDFETDLNHPLRQALAQSHMLDWAPQAPIKLMYCNGDEQVTYLNSELAYDAWIANGSTQVEKIDFGAFSHNDCAQYAFLNGIQYFDSYKVCYNVSNNDIKKEIINVYPNPSTENIRFEGLSSDAPIRISNAMGQMIFSGSLTQGNLNISSLQNGIYFFEINEDSSDIVHIGKFTIMKN